MYMYVYLQYHYVIESDPDGRAFGSDLYFQSFTPSQGLLLGFLSGDAIEQVGRASMSTILCRRKMQRF